jgi:N-acetylneuraminate synthase
MKFSRSFRIGNREVGEGCPVYFVADIAANHDGDLRRAVELVHLAARSGADAVKFQHFHAATIVSDRGFRELQGLRTHQSTWKRSVVDVYADASVPAEWTLRLTEASREAGVDFFTSPYSFELVDAVAPHVQAFKVGSGDITWPAIIRRMASHGKPVILAAGASTLGEVADALKVLDGLTNDVALMQCNTNYTGSPDNFRHLHLNVLRSFAATWPGLVLGLSDHTQGVAPILGGVALGAKIVERHFTDDRSRTGPDHAFATDPAAWREMVDRTRELEAALGGFCKEVAANEVETRVVQRRALRASRNLPKGHVLAEGDLVPLRPCPPDAISPTESDRLLGQTLVEDLPAGRHVTWRSVV